MATTTTALPDAETGARTYEQVLAEVSAADPQTFYLQAQRFEQAASSLGDTKDLLRRYRRDLAEAWHSGDKQRYNRIDRLVQHIEGVVAAIRDPGYAMVLRRIGDVIVDSQQRLRSMKDDAAHAKDASARADLDKRAVKILEELSTSYRQLGGELAELPQRTAAGKPMDSMPARTTTTGNTAASAAGPVLHQGVAPGMAMPGRATARFTTSISAPMTQNGFSGAQAQPVLTGSAVQTETATPFTRFSQYANCPAYATGSVQGGKAVLGPAARTSANRSSYFSQKDTAKPSVLGRTVGSGGNGATNDGVKQEPVKENGVKKYAVEQSKGSGRMGSFATMSNVAMPAMLESRLSLPASGEMPVLFSATAGPDGWTGNAAPAALQATATAGGLPNGVVNPGGTPSAQPASATTAPAQASTQPAPAATAQAAASIHSAAAPSATTTAVTSPTASAPAPAPALAGAPGPGTVPVQARSAMALGAEHLSASALSPGGAPLAAAAASASTPPPPMGAGSMMRAAGPSLPAGPHGVLGGSRGDAVWLRADPGSWAHAPVVSGRIGRYESTADSGTWSGTARYNEFGREDR